MADVNSTVAEISIPTELRDGFEVHAAALRHGLDVALYPRQVLIARDPDSGKELSFVHGIPESAQLGPVTYAQDKRMRRALMESAGLPIPRGVTFSVGRGVNAAKQFAERIGYPVVVKPAIGDNAIEVFAGINNEDEFDEAVDKLRVTPSERETFTRAAYGLTELREPGEEDGRIVVPPGYRFLVEEHVHGSYLRMLVLNHAVHSAVLTDGSPGLGPIKPGREVLDEVHPSLLQLAVRAVAAVPGLPLAAVDLVVEDHQRAADKQQARIVEFSERPGLALQAASSAHQSAELGDNILQSHFSDMDLEPKAQHENVVVQWSVEAVPDPDRATRLILATANDSGIGVGKVEINKIEGCISSILSGSANRIAELSELLLQGSLDGIRAMHSKAVQIDST